MNLKDFLNYREICPTCGAELKTVFHSKRKQIIRQEDGVFKVFFPLSQLSFKSTYKACYCINENNNSIYIDFYKENTPLTQVSLEWLKTFKQFDFNLKSYQVYKTCEACINYSYSSNLFYIDYKNCSIGSLDIFKEAFTFTKNNNFYKLYNDYHKQSSYILYGNNEFYSGFLDIPFLLEFSTTEKMVEKISKLIIFS